MPTVRVQELVKRAADLLRRIQEEKTEYVVTDPDQPVAVLSPIDRGRKEEPPAAHDEPDTFRSDALDFWEDRTLEEMAHAQGVTPIQSIEELSADFWPETESLDEFITTVRKWRSEDRG